MESLKKLMRNKRANMALVGLVIGIIVVFVALALALPIGMLLKSKIITNINSTMSGSFSTTENQTLADLSSGIDTGFSLMAYLPYIVAGSAIIGALITGFMFMKRD